MQKCQNMSKHVQTCVCSQGYICPATSVARVPQHKQLSRRGIKDGVHRNTWIGTSDDGTVRRLVVLHQGLPHLAGGGAGRHRASGETLIAGLRCPEPKSARVGTREDQKWILMHRGIAWSLVNDWHLKEFFNSLLSRCNMKPIYLLTLSQSRYNRMFGCPVSGCLRCMSTTLPHSQHLKHPRNLWILQQLQSHIRGNALVCRCAHTMEATTFSLNHGIHGRRDGGSAAQQLTLDRRLSKEFNLSRLQMVDPTLELHPSRLDSLSDAVTKFQQEIHAVEDVHLHGMCCHFIWTGTRSQFVCCFLGHGAKVFQQTLQGRAGLFRLSLRLLGIQKSLSGAVDGSAFGMAQHQNQTAPKLAGAELKRTHHAALSVSTWLVPDFDPMFKIITCNAYTCTNMHLYMQWIHANAMRLAWGNRQKHKVH